MKIAMVGTGYVGLVSGACFSEFGWDVVCVDLDADKIKMLEAGELSAQEYQLYMRNSRIDRKTFLLEQMEVVDRMNHGEGREHEGLQRALASKLGSMAAL